MPYLVGFICILNSCIVNNNISFVFRDLQNIFLYLSFFARSLLTGPYWGFAVHGLITMTSKYQNLPIAPIRVNPPIDQLQEQMLQ